MEALLNLPENWHVVVTDENIDLLKKWRSKDAYIIKGDIVGMNKWEDGRITKEHNRYADDDFGQEITTADFKRLVLGEKNYKDFGVFGCQELEKYLRSIKSETKGNLRHLTYFIKDNKWQWSDEGNSTLKTLPLKEYLKLLPTEKTETMENEIQITKTWETIFFTNGKSTVELTLNHDKKTFDLQTQNEEAVSFKKDTIESAKEKLKCIESALEYTEKYLNK